MTGEITARIDRTELLRLLDATKPPAATRRTSELAALLPPRAPARGRRPTLTIPIPVVRAVPPPPRVVATARPTTARVAIVRDPVIEPRPSRLARILERFAGFLFAGLC